MNLVIGVDPHKASHTAVAIDEAEDEVSSVKVCATGRQVEQLVRWAEPFEKRKWAIESAGGLGYLLAAKRSRGIASDLHFQSGCRDLNPGPLDPQSSALTKLRHSPHVATALRNRCAPRRPPRRRRNQERPSDGSPPCSEGI